MRDAKAKTQAWVDGHRITILVRGNWRFPAEVSCPRVLRILAEFGAAFETYDLLADAGLRVAEREFARRPTSSRPNVDGEFVGGCDLVTRLPNSGELASLPAPRRTARGVPWA